MSNMECINCNSKMDLYIISKKTGFSHYYCKKCDITVIVDTDGNIRDADLKRSNIIGKYEDVDYDKFSIEIKTLSLPTLSINYIIEKTKSRGMHKRNCAYKNEYHAPNYNKREFKLTNINLKIFKEMEALNDEIDIINKKLSDIVNKLE